MTPGTESADAGNPVAAISYLARAQALRKSNDKASPIYAALELRCGVEARMQAYAAVAHGVSKREAEDWRIDRLGRTLEEAFGLGDSMLVVFVAMEDGRADQFLYAPVTAKLQDIAMRCGDCLHAMPPERVISPEFWSELRSMITEGCGLLELASQARSSGQPYPLVFTSNCRKAILGFRSFKTCWRASARRYLPQH